MPALKKRRKHLPWAVIFFFFVLYSLVSLVNHYMYRTFALDLGMFNQAIYSYAHGRNAVFTLNTTGAETPFLATHFSPITLLYAPFYYLWGSYTLLIIQILAILAGGAGIYKIADISIPKNNRTILLLVLIQFFFCWGIFSALSYDFHNNVIGAMLVPWLIYYYKQKKRTAVVLCSLLILTTQETMALWLIFILIGLIIEQRKKTDLKSLLKLEIPLTLFCLIYTLVVLAVVMPALQGEANNLQLTRYTHLGNSFSTIITNIFTQPVSTFRMFFSNTLYGPEYDGIKAELYIMVLASGGIFLLARPVYLLMLLPIFAQKMLSNDFGFWGINGQYSIELIPVISLAFIAFLSKAKKGMLPLVVIVLCSTIFFTFNALDHRTSKWYNPANNRFYGEDHFKAGLNITGTNRALKSIPENIPVSSCSRLAPHIANRDRLYHFPVTKDALYIVLEKAGIYPYPLEKESYLQAVDSYRKMPGWAIDFENRDLIIFKRK